MVFRSDPRAGYCKIDFNMEWFYQYLDERGEELIQTTCVDGVYLSNEELERRERVLDGNIERAVEYWIGYSVFGNKSPRIILYKEIDLSGYESVWDVMYDVLMEFLAKYPDYYTLKAVE